MPQIALSLELFYIVYQQKSLDFVVHDFHWSQNELFTDAPQTPLFQHLVGHLLKLVP